MGRRSDHSRQELEALILTEGRNVMEEGGLAGFSAREVAKRIGYSIGTIYNVVGNFDRLVIRINTQTFGLWADYLRLRLEAAGPDRLQALVRGYFDFARERTNLWSAIFEHRLPADIALTDEDHYQRAQLTSVVVDEVAGALDQPIDDDVVQLTRSLIATVHGHCSFELNGAWAMMGETDPETTALARVREAIAQRRR